MQYLHYSPPFCSQFHLRSAVLFFQRLLNGGSRRRSIIGRREQRGVGGELRNMDGMGSIGTGSRECNPSRGNLKSLFPADGGTRNACIDDSTASSTGNNVHLEQKIDVEKGAKPGTSYR
ncbi:hypothetical protein SDJN02_20438 [Cucurbita argyrosperma subsp. argyrosperma]|nr:hypothetical protein SDJN02_20438 [Cucurbita argyrosperma subsp. argyrosperma]